MDTATIRAEARLKSARLQIVKHLAFASLSGVIAMDGITLSREVKHARVTGASKVLNPDWVESLTQKQTNYVLIHLGAHLAFQHQFTWARLFQLNPKRAHLAADYFVNSLILDTDPTSAFAEKPLSEHWVFSADYAGMSVGEIYARMPKGLEDTLEGFDEIVLTPSSSQEPEKDLMERIRVEAQSSTISNALRTAGQDAGSFSEKIREAAQTHVPWQTVLGEAMRADLIDGNDWHSWAKLSRRGLSRGEMRPGHVSNTIGAIAVTFDTSCSRTGGELGQDLAELKSLFHTLSPSKVIVLQVDSIVQERCELLAQDFDNYVSTFEAAGRGGTDMREAFLDLELHRDVVAAHIIFTDGETPYPKVPPQYPTYWIISSTKIRPPFGRAIYYDPT